MTILIVLQFVVVLAAIWMGARSSGVGLGLWGAVGLPVVIEIVMLSLAAVMLVAMAAVVKRIVLFRPSHGVDSALKDAS
jgi:anaerobic C4-dicarboxylate transporter DcuA